MKPFATLACLLFSLVCLGHILRLVLKLEVLVGGLRIPMWVSAAGAAMVGTLAVMLWRESRRS